MKKQGFIVLAIAFAIMLTSVNSSFAAHHMPHKGHSPMDKVGKGLSLHCILKGHDISNPCPHLMAKSEVSEKFSLSSSCGGKDPSQNPFSYDSGGSSYFELLDVPDYTVYDLKWTTPLYKTNYLPIEFSTLDPPPKLF